VDDGGVDAAAVVVQLVAVRQLVLHRAARPWRA
jgi:hypothetical protein